MSLRHALEQLIRFKTVTGNHEAVHEAFDWIKNQVSVAPLYTKEHNHNGYKSLIMTTKRTRSPKVWLAAHIDVVTGSDAVFKPKDEGDRLVGRGTFDMKFAIACYIELLKELGAEARKYDFGIIIVSDEEVRGGSMGAVLEDLGLSGQVAFLPDGGGEWQFEEAAKAAYCIKAKAQGVTAHGSRPWHGESAIMNLHAFVGDVVAKMKSFETNDPYCWYPTLNVSQFSGGDTWNQVADYAEATLDIRFTHEREKKKIDSVLKRLQKVHPRITLETVFVTVPCSVGRGNGEAKVFKKIAKEKYGIEVGWKKSYGGSDAEFFYKRNVPTLLIWPRAGGAHSEHEWIDLEDFERYYQVMKEWVKTVAAGEPKPKKTRS